MDFFCGLLEFCGHPKDPKRGKEEQEKNRIAFMKG